MTRPRHVFGRRKIAFGGADVRVSMTAAEIVVRPKWSRQEFRMPLHKVAAWVISNTVPTPTNKSAVGNGKEK